jgi:hypothetical protein
MNRHIKAPSGFEPLLPFGQTITVPLSNRMVTLEEAPTRFELVYPFAEAR